MTDDDTPSAEDVRSAERIAFELGREEGLAAVGIVPPAWIQEEAARAERRRLTGVLLIEALAVGCAWLIGSILGEYWAAGKAGQR